MLYVKRLFLIDSAEEKAQWLHRAKQQWGTNQPLAVRVKSDASVTLGSTTPKALSYQAEEDSWCASWLEEATTPQTQTPKPITATTTPSDAPLTAEAEAPTATAASPAEGASTGTPREEVTRSSPAHTEGLENHETPPVAEEDAAEETVTDTAADSGPPTEVAPPSDNAAPAQTSEPTDAPLAPAGDELIGIDLSPGVADGLVVLEVVTLAGEVKSTTVVNVSSVFREGPVEHFAVVLTPLSVEAMDDRAIHGVLEFTVVRQDCLTELLTTHGGSALQLVTHGAQDPMPTPVEDSSVALSTNQLYFPSSLLTGTGAFIVSNVVCVESRCADKAVSLEFVVTGDSQLIKMSPTTATLAHAGDRVFVVCTWDLFRPFTRKPAEETGAAVKVHLLLREDGVNVAPVDLHLHAELPRPAATNPAFLFWVNNTMITNASCSEAELASIRAVLPVYDIQKKIVEKAAQREAEETAAFAEARGGATGNSEGKRPWWKISLH